MISTEYPDAAAPPEWWRCDKDTLLLAYVAREREKRRLEAEQGQILAEIESREVKEVTGYATLPGMLVDWVQIKHSEAKARVDRARALNSRQDGGTRIPALAPHAAAAALAGDLGAAQLDPIIAALGALPATVSAEDRETGEEILVNLARTAGPRQISHAAKNLRDRLDPDGREPKDPDPAEPRHELGFVTHRDGTHGIKIKTDADTIARLKATLDPLAKPRPTTEEEGRDTRSQWERLGDAFATFVRIGMGNPDIPTQAGDSVHVVVTLGLDELKTGIGRACLDLVGDISATEARLLACDCKVIPVTLGSHGEPLDVGRAQRLATPAQRRALAIRDGGCAFPGCDAPPQQCTAHHIVFWAHHGETRIDNLVLLCGRHHRLIHNSDWEVRIASDGYPEFIPPAFIDPARAPRRNTMHTTRT
ncbi:HNH endonuclease [Amycolatopsis xylanica]|uniref:HNH endonuclease n=1 Tax=Amycolatopsis xylanica TaxID=589385 RepID=A0A1H3DDG4_9PSEU|nr:HNH endonuclease signature motif containing protein [Amycolatopsis xylanica]SDX63719.1 HNH endonuclease [Amycolatopsis xylanica]